MNNHGGQHRDGSDPSEFQGNLECQRLRASPELRHGKARGWPLRQGWGAGCCGAKKSALGRDLGALGKPTPELPDAHLQPGPSEDQGSGVWGRLEGVRTVEMGDGQYYSVKQSMLLFFFFF